MFRSFSLALGMWMYRDTMQIAYTPHVRQEHARLWFGSKRSCAALAVFDPKPMFLIYRCLGVLPCVLVFVSCLGLSLLVSRHGFMPWFLVLVSCLGFLPCCLALVSCLGFLFWCLALVCCFGCLASGSRLVWLRWLQQSNSSVS